METGSILDRKSSVRSSIDEETVDAMRVAFHRSPRKSIRVASNELAIPRSTVHKVHLMQHELISLGCDEMLHAQHQLIKKLSPKLNRQIFAINSFIYTELYDCYTTETIRKNESLSRS